MSNTKLKRQDLIYPEISYNIVGILYEVYNEMGGGHKEKYYQNAVEAFLKEKKIPYKRELHTPLKFKGYKVGHYFLDFLIEDKIVLELKRGDYFAPNDVQQILSYLKATGLQLGILAIFTRSGVKIKRIINEIENQNKFVYS
jgi:GxxExxY protein